MKIAILATAHKPIALNALGGTEVFTYWLTEKLIKNGHDVTLFAHPNSKTNARLITPKTWVNTASLNEKKFWSNQLNLLSEAFDYIQKNNFNIVHNNLFETFPALSIIKFLRNKRFSSLSTVHNPYFNQTKTAKMFLPYSKENFVFVSKFALNKAKKNGFQNSKFIYNGVSLETFKPASNPSRDYLFWIGRIYDKKGVDDAIKVAIKARIKLIISGGIDNEKSQFFFDNEIKPYIDNKQIIYLGPVNLKEKIHLYQNALSLIFPVKWDEPFGLVAAESLACGTPVIGYERGALPEIIEHGKNGFLVKEGKIDELSQYVHKMNSINPENCYGTVAENFSIDKMVNEYEKLYEQIL